MERVHTGSRISTLIALLAVSSAPSTLIAGNPVTCRITRSADRAIHVSWENTHPHDGYAVATTAHLGGGTWGFAGDVDQWPTRDTDWHTTGDPRTTYYRVDFTDRGRLIDYTTHYTLDPPQIESILDDYGIGGIDATYPVTIAKLVYETFDHRGQSTLASGALCVPIGPSSAPVVSYQHGTIFERLEAPSNPGAGDQGVGLAFATEGYIVALPDYLGLGAESPPFHPYVHARSEAVASVDMLRAAYRLLASVPKPAPNGRLFLVGYSQGGHATLALQRELEAYHAGEFPVTASAPMAGPHDLSGVMKDLLLADAPYGSPSYFAGALFGLNTVYLFFDAASEILTSPYDATLPPLIDGMHAAEDVDAVMPAIPKQIFQEAFLSDFESNTDNPFHRALRANDTYRGWIPVTPTRFYHCAGDTIVPRTNSERAVADFLLRGATTVSLHDPAPLADHEAGTLPCFLAAKAWFDTLRTP